MGENGESEPETLTGFDADEVFALVGNETRAAIVHALGEAGGRDVARATLSFSELRKRVGGDVRSSQFNYHLQQLVGSFVEHVDDGYRLHRVGMRLYRTIVAGTFTQRELLDPFEVGVDCYFCGSAVEAAYEDAQFMVQCPDCGHAYIRMLMPPSAVDTDDDAELLARVDQFNRRDLLAYGRGVCTICAHPLDTQLIPAADAPMAGSAELDVFVHRPCDHCGAQPHVTLGLALLYDPDVVSFFRERGLDVTSTPVWELEFAMTDRYTTVRSTDPWEVALELTRDGDTLELVVDGDLNVAERNLPE
ncbi:winged helix-turn-helix domain-containing protein [Halobacterium zhouii]|uniref:winged helix-turn-helix domain-containing protein n=1 Tax=Halobacterium zhouii TaxID=2902624 RepID=UPI001E4443C9|nr:helix-turn-helix domain-containing protein [Halobacterium zhouii]